MPLNNSPLWFGLYLPQLSLDIYQRTQCNESLPLVICQGQGRNQFIVAANDAAQQRDIQPGLTLSAAYALCEQLVSKPRLPEKELEQLQQLGEWAIQFSSQVSLTPPQGLLLEIGGSLRLFHGLENLCQAIQLSLEQLGFQFQFAIAPTALAAQQLAEYYPGQQLLTLEKLHQLLPKLPIELLSLEEKQQQKLEKLGIHLLGELLRLPRQGLLQRYGNELILQLEKLQGTLPDPRPRFVPAESFQRQIELPVAVSNTQALLFVGQRLLLELEAFLRSRCAATQNLHWQLWHEEGVSTQFSLQLIEANWQHDYIRDLLQQRLERIQLPSAVTHMALRVEELQRQVNHNQTLFHTTQASADWQSLAEKLISRLGEEAVHSLSCEDDHRPEQACKTTTPGQGKNMPQAENLLRPLWLLEPPKLLQCRQQQPWHQGPLHIIDGSERIEHGWWDGNDVRRDYYLAQTPQGRWLWIFREHRKPYNWYLHGFFD